ncbi:hypothetical protein COOONC_00661 [Cooperia oncophora]
MLSIVHSIYKIFKIHLFEESPPEGLVRVREDIQIKPRAGVSAVLARRLAASVTGSFSKYDGERATHHYQGGQPSDSAVKAASPPMLEALDGIEAAVYRGQDRLKESDRRASSVSFHKVYKQELVSPEPFPAIYALYFAVVCIVGFANACQAAQAKEVFGEHQSKVGSPHHLTEKLNIVFGEHKVIERIAVIRRQIPDFLPKTHQFASQSRGTSPSATAVQFAYIAGIDHFYFLTTQASTSGDSLESERTARTSHSPVLPRRYSRPDTSLHSLQSTASSRQTLNYCDVALPAVANSSSSSTSVNSRVEYVTIDPVSTTAAREVRHKF